MSKLRFALGSALVGLIASCASTSVRDLQGNPLDPLAASDARAVLLLFVDPECPISNAFAPEVRRLHQEFAPRGVSFFLVYADRDRSLEELRIHVSSFDYPMPAVFDVEHELVERTGAALTPEACVCLPDGELVYRGRIDDRYVDFGKQRAAPSSHDLRAALTAVLEGRRPKQPWPPAIGCWIP